MIVPGSTTGSPDAAAPLPALPTMPPPPRPRLWTLVVACVALIVGFVVLSAVVFTGVALVAGSDPVHGGALSSTANLFAIFETLPGLLFTAAASSLWIGTVAILAGVFSPKPLVERLGLARPHLALAGLLLAILGGLAVSQASDAFLQASGLGRGEALNHIFALLRRARGAQLAASVLVVGVLAGTVEELFFRGYLQRRLIERLGPFGGIAITSVLFALAHLDPRHALFALAFGGYVGWIAWRTGSVWPGVVVHVVNNVCSVLMLAFSIGDGETSARANAIVLAISAVVVVGAVAALRRQFAR